MNEVLVQLKWLPSTWSKVVKQTVHVWYNGASDSVDVEPDATECIYTFPTGCTGGFQVSATDSDGEVRTSDPCQIITPDGDPINPIDPDPEFLPPTELSYIVNP